LRPHVWQKRGIGKELHLVSNVDAVTKAKAIVVKLERRCHDDRLLHVARRCTDFHHLRATDAGVRRTLRDDSRNSRCCTRDNALHITEG
jgi:hypothetical protein